jgi:hypothetical protein
MRVLTNCHDVPYCDDFNVEEEWYVASMPSSTRSSAIRISSVIVFPKFSMMKKKITQIHDDETALFWKFWKE